MNFLEAVPAVRRIDTDREDLFAIDVVGHVAAADAENLFGLLEAAYALHPKIDVLVRLIDHEGVDWADVSDETIEQGIAHAVEHIGRCAAIGEPNWIPEAIAFLPASLPIELRHFEAEDEAAAWEWLGANPIAQR
ncbi:STAS/SEC14 domain-containing protein [Mesorhizobium sp. M0663]|uniref:STAS/SEC14 domain-containing protein n=1 Tax=Mesorhizobium sp. M0663 TaxID=2956981 RepID=UPI00333589A8